MSTSLEEAQEDVELRDLVAQTLEKNGCLGKLRAQLRASIFLALDEDIKLSKQQPLQNLRIQSYLETPEGRAMFSLVREFLDFFNLQFTISVYEPESYLESIGQYEGRQKVAKDLGLDNTEEATVPLLQQLLKIAQAKSKILDINLNVNSNINGNYMEESLNIDSSYKKTESSNTLSKSSSKNDSTTLESDQNNASEPIPVENIHYLNNTFDLNSPTVNLSHLTKISSENMLSKNILKDPIQEEDTLESSNQSLIGLGNNISHKNVNYLGEKNDNISNPTASGNEMARNGHLKKIIKEDDTYEDTSSIAEDSEAVVNAESLKTTEKSEYEVPLPSPPNTSSFKFNENALQPPTTAALKVEPDKPKLSPQRPKTSLSSLTDLPPLSINKSRVNNDILPSLYSKEFKSKSNLKELDKLFDMDAEYEEDFMYSSNQLSEPSVVNKIDSEKSNILHRKETKSSNKAISDTGKTAFKPSVSKACSNLLKTGEQSTNGSMSEHSLSD